MYYCGIKDKDIIQKLTYTFIFLFTAFILCSAQNEYDEGELEQDFGLAKLVELSFDYTKPIGLYKTRFNETGYGVSFSYLHQIKLNGPAFIGGDFHWSQFFRLSNLFQDPLGDIRENTTGNITGLNLLFRFYPELNLPIIEPYFETVIGGRFIYTGTNFVLEETGENIDFVFDQTDFIFSYGAGGGFHIPLGGGWFANFKGNFMFGTNGAFLSKDETLPSNGQTLSDLLERSAPIRTVRFQIGITYSI